MSNEARITSSLYILKDNIDYQSRPVTFLADVDGSKGPTPGCVAVSVWGTLIDLSQLVQPGLCRIQNLDDSDIIDAGIWDGTSFYPMLEFLPGNSFVMRLSRDIGEESGMGSSTSTTGRGTNRLMLKARGGGSGNLYANALIEAFES